MSEFHFQPAYETATRSSAETSLPCPSSKVFTVRSAGASFPLQVSVGSVPASPETLGRFSLSRAADENNERDGEDERGQREGRAAHEISLGADGCRTGERHRHPVNGGEWRRVANSSRGPFLAGQLKDSPQAQVPAALGLSIVKPCFSIVSAKSMVAPER